MVLRILSLKNDVTSLFKDLSVFCIEKNRITDVQASIENNYTYVSFVLNESFDDYCILDDIFADDILRGSFTISLDQRQKFNKPELGLRKVKVRFRLNDIKISIPHNNSIYLYYSNEEVFDVEKDEIPPAWHKTNGEVNAFENGEFLVRGLYVTSWKDNNGKPAFDLEFYERVLSKANMLLTGIFEGEPVEVIDETLPPQIETKVAIINNEETEKAEISVKNKMLEIKSFLEKGFPHRHFWCLTLPSISPEVENAGGFNIVAFYKPDQIVFRDGLGAVLDLKILANTHTSDYCEVRFLFGVDFTEFSANPDNGEIIIKNKTFQIYVVNYVEGKIYNFESLRIKYHNKIKKMTELFSLFVETKQLKHNLNMLTTNGTPLKYRFTPETTANLTLYGKYEPSIEDIKTVEENAKINPPIKKVNPIGGVDIDEVKRCCEAASIAYYASADAEMDDVEIDYQQITVTAEEKLERLRKLFKP